MNPVTAEQLRERYPPAQGRAVSKELRALDVHCRRFIELSPFLVMSTGNRLHQLDASPRGGAPGFVKVDADGEVLIPDAPGNNRLDSLQNIADTGQIGLLFMIPGVDETLRVNGTALLSAAEADIAACTDDRRAPRLVIRVRVEAAYLHCAKALMRSSLWSPEARVDRAVLPTMARMLRDQTGLDTPDESQQEMVRRYARDL